MYLNYAALKNGTDVQPVLRLRTLSGKELGAIPFVHDLKFTINYSDVSTIEFTVPFMVNGMLNPLYGSLTSYKVVYTEELGVYILSSPEKTGDGVKEEKTVRGYSLEELFDKKSLFLDEGTYNFWNPAKWANTILGRIVELDPSWHVGYVAPRLIGCYRTFDQYDSSALGFLYGDAMEKYRCAIVFNVYDKSINAYDANEDAEMLPIYLNYQNLVEEVQVEEITDELVTKLHIYGSDDLTIRDVNPAGTDYLVDLSYFIQNGDLDVTPSGSTMMLSEKVQSWQTSLKANRQYYAALVAERASLTAQKLAAQAQLTELNGELDSLTAQQSVTIQAFALENTESGRNNRQAQLNGINSNISAKRSEIDAQQSTIDEFQREIDQTNASILAVHNELAYEAYFTENERKVLGQYMIEGSMEDETFVATQVETTDSGALSSVTGTVAVTGAEVYRAAISQFNKTMYSIKGGTLNVNSASLSADIVRGTLEVKSGNGYVFTAYLGDTSYNGHNFQSGMFTLSGSYSNNSLSSDVTARTADEVTEYVGSNVSFSTSGAKSFFTVSMSEFQKYSVAMELYDFGEEALSDAAWPVYEFSLDTANFLFQEKFEPFKKQLELGKAAYLALGSEGILHAKVIGMELDYEDITRLSLVFSNRYQLKNGMERWIEEIQSASRAARSFDASKYIYNRTADMTTSVNEFMEGLSKGAVDAVLNSANLSVSMGSNGIQIGGDSNYQMRLTDSMLAMTDDGWETAKVGLGRFLDASGNVIWGVNAEMIAGNLLIGNSLVLQNPLVDENGQATGVMQFSVDATGAWLYNSRIVLQSDEGLIIVDPDYGIVAGTQLLFDTNGTTVTPEFLNELGTLTYDADGMPKNANFYLDVNTGDAYFRGKLIAKSGRIGGFTIEDSFLRAGSEKSFVGLNGSTNNQYGSYDIGLYAMWCGAENPSEAKFYVKKDGTLVLHGGNSTSGYVTLNGATTGDYSAYAIWCGSENPSNDKFWVKKDGSMNAKSATIQGEIQADSGYFKGDITGASGTFSGTVQAEDFLDSKGNSMINSSGQFTADYLDLYGLTVYKVNSWGQKTNDISFQVASDGTITMTGEVHMGSNSSIDWSAIDESGSDAYKKADAAATAAGNAKTAAESVQTTIDSWSYVYEGKTYIDGNELYVGRVTASKLRGGSVDLLDGSGLTAASFTLDGASSYEGRKVVINSGAIEISAKYGDVFIQEGSYYGANLQLTNGEVQVYGKLLPKNDDSYQCGDTFKRWTDIYCMNDTINTSDRNEKQDISYEIDQYSLLFDALKPCSFRFIDGHGRTHLGLISQDVEAALTECGLASMDFAGFIKFPKKDGDGNLIDGEYGYGLRYGEFTALLIDQVQKLKRRVALLEGRDDLANA